MATLMQRVQALQHQLPLDHHATAASRDGTGGASVADVTEETLCRDLIQALENGDSSQVEPLLLHVSDKLVKRAASLLPANHASALLAVAVSHIHARPGGNAKFVVAVRALLLSLPAALMDNEGAQEAVAMLQRSIAAREAAQPALLGLSGRLDLALAQLPAQTAAAESRDQRVNLGSVSARRSGYDSDGEEPMAVDAFAEGTVGGDPSESEDEGDAPSEEEAGDDESEDAEDSDDEE